MTALASAIEKQARKLSVAERERLAERLLAQTEDEPLTVVEEAWVLEAERRFSAWKRKKTKPIPAAKAIGDIRRALRL
jgi:putative addiction module component